MQKKIEIFHIQACAKDKKYGMALNNHIKLLPQDCWVVVRDLDTLILDTSNYIQILEEAIIDNPDAVLFTCSANRHWPRQLDQDPNITNHIEISKNRKKKYSFCSTILPAFFWMFHRSLWVKYPFDNKPLIWTKSSFDSRWTKQIPGIRVRIEHLYIWHTYRLGGEQNYNHLL